MNIKVQDILHIGDDIDEKTTLFFSLLIVTSYHLIFRNYFPLSGELMGHDYSLAIPGLIDGYLWYFKNGFFDVPWFSPSFSAGQPFFADPQSIFYSVPQFLVFFYEPIDAIYKSVLLFAVAGFVGMYFFARISLSVDRWRSLICATIFLFNGFYIHRMIVGHFGYQSFMLAPLLAMVLLRQLAARPVIQADLFSASLAGVIIGYWFQSGLTTLIIPATLATVALILIKLLIEGNPISLALISRFLLAILISFGLSASKLVAGLSLMQNFPREFYLLPGIKTISGVLLAVFQMLFYSSEHAYKTLTPLWSNMQWGAQPHELAFGLTPLVFLGLVLWPLLNQALLPQLKIRLLVGRVPLGLLALIVLIPLSMLYYTPEWNHVLKQVPLIGSTTSPWRWLIILVPSVALLGGLVVGGNGPFRYAIGFLLLAGIPLLNALEDRSFYDSQNFPTTALTEFYRDVESGKVSPAIAEVADPQAIPGLFPNSLFSRGLSPIRCYNPLFGYRLEKLDTSHLQLGSYLLQKDDHYNFRNPACLVFPAENNCRLWDNFSVDQKSQLQSFVSYRGFDFKKSKTQLAANVVTWLTLAFLLAYFLTIFVHDLMKRR